MLFFGANINENINISANGGRARFIRDVANITMDLDDVESIDFRAFGGADNIVVGDLTGTDVTSRPRPWRLRRRRRRPGRHRHRQWDPGADPVRCRGRRRRVTVFGLQATVKIFNQEQANDRLTLDAWAERTSLCVRAEGRWDPLTINGGLGADLILGSEGDDLINGGDGNDTALMGGGNDTFVWNPGDDNDTLEGQAGFDTMLFNGANIAENIESPPTAVGSGSSATSPT